VDELLYAEESYAIRGAVFEVYREMGTGFLDGDQARARGPAPELSEGNGHGTWIAGQLRQLPERGGRTEDSLSPDPFRGLPGVPWLEYSFPIAMQTASDAFAWLAALPRDRDEAPRRQRPWSHRTMN